MVGCDNVKLGVFLFGTAPATLVRAVVGVKVGLVPDFPVFDVIVKAICPTLGIVSYNMLTDLCPFLEILGLNCAVFLDAVLYL